MTFDQGMRCDIAVVCRDMTDRTRDERSLRSTLALIGSAGRARTAFGEFACRDNLAKCGRMLRHGELCDHEVESRAALQPQRWFLGQEDLVEISDVAIDRASALFAAVGSVLPDNDDVAHLPHSTFHSVNRSIASQSAKVRHV